MAWKIWKKSLKRPARLMTGQNICCKSKCSSHSIRTNIWCLLSEQDEYWHVNNHSCDAINTARRWSQTAACNQIGDWTGDRKALVELLPHVTLTRTYHEARQAPSRGCTPHRARMHGIALRRIDTWRVLVTHIPEIYEIMAQRTSK